MAAAGRVGLFFESLITLVVVVAVCAVVGFMAVSISGGRNDEAVGGAIAGAAIGGGLVLLKRLVQGAVRGRAKLKGSADLGTIVAMSKEPHPGAPWYHGFYVLIDIQGKRHKLKVPPEQAKTFSERFAVGDVGRVIASRKELVQFVPASATAPVRPKAGVRVFVSYAHGRDQEGQMAEYMAEVFQTAGLEPWLDKTEVKPGQKLRDELAARIRDADFFVPLLSPEYVSSDWCLKEFETAADAGIPMRPIKISEGRLVPPPYLKKIYDEKAGEPVYLDMTSREAPAKLRAMAEEMAGKAQRR
jgi:hypothetical protein